MAQSPDVGFILRQVPEQLMHLGVGPILEGRFLVQPRRHHVVAAPPRPRRDLTRKRGIFGERTRGRPERYVPRDAVLNPQLEGRERVADTTLKGERFSVAAFPQGAAARRAGVATRSVPRLSGRITLIGHWTRDKPRQKGISQQVQSISPDDRRLAT